MVLFIGKTGRYMHVLFFIEHHISGRPGVWQLKLCVGMLLNFYLGDSIM